MCVCTDGCHAYTVRVIKRTSINLDLDLVAEAREVLGTKNTTDTVHTALRKAVRRERLKRVAALRFDHMPDEWWDELERGEHWPDDDDT
jgi:Arc/MetJ family transcription regulator